MSLASRITDIRKLRKMSVDDLAEKSGVPKSTLAKISAGITPNPSLETVKAIAAALSCRLDDFDDIQSPNTPSISPRARHTARLYDRADDRAREIVDFTLKPFDTDATPPIVEFAEEIAPRITTLPLYLQSAAAGLGNYIDDDYYDMVDFENPPPRANIAVRISGDSMEPDYPDGCIVFVETDSVLEDGEIGIFNLDGDSYIKRLRLNPPRLVSLNKAYADIVIKESSDCRTTGRVVGKVVK